MAPASPATSIRDLSEKYYGSRVTVIGEVRRIHPEQRRLTEAAIECLRCRTVAKFSQSIFSEELVDADDCPECGHRFGPTSSTVHQTLSEGTIIQVVDLVGSPRYHRLQVVLKGSIIGTVGPGDRVRFTGELGQRREPKIGDMGVVEFPFMTLLADTATVLSSQPATAPRQREKVPAGQQVA